MTSNRGYTLLLGSDASAGTSSGSDDGHRVGAGSGVGVAWEWGAGGRGGGGMMGSSTGGHCRGKQSGGLAIGSIARGSNETSHISHAARTTNNTCPQSLSLETSPRPRTGRCSPPQASSLFTTARFRPWARLQPSTAASPRLWPPASALSRSRSRNRRRSPRRCRPSRSIAHL